MSARGHTTGRPCFLQVLSVVQIHIHNVFRWIYLRTVAHLRL